MSTAYIPNRAKRELLKGTFILLSHSLKAALMASGFTFDIDSHNIWSDVSASEVSGVGNNYSQQTISGNTVTQNNTTDKGIFTCNYSSFSAIGGDIGPAAGLLIYDDDGGDNILVYFEFDSPETISDGYTTRFSGIQVEVN